MTRFDTLDAGYGHPSPLEVLMSTRPPHRKARRLLFVVRLLWVAMLAALAVTAIARIRRRPRPAPFESSDNASDETTVTKMVAVSADAGYAYPEEGDVLLAMHDDRVHSAATTGTAPGEVRVR